MYKNLSSPRLLVRVLKKSIRGLFHLENRKAWFSVFSEFHGLTNSMKFAAPSMARVQARVLKKSLRGLFQLENRKARFSPFSEFQQPVIAYAVAVMTILAILPLSRAYAETGEELFTKVCVACHTVGGGKRIGPDLAGVTQRRSNEWLHAFITSSQTVIKSGDPAAVKLFNEFNKFPMPDSGYSVDQIDAVLAYIVAAAPQGAPAKTPAAAPETPKRKSTENDIQMGREMFQGNIRFAGNGPACNSCHHVQNDAVAGGGILAKDLTSVTTRMGGSGVEAILGNPPFPVMRRAYKDRVLTPDEIFSLVAFLQEADKEKDSQKTRNYGVTLFAGGTGGFVALMVLYALVWGRRKKRPVNHDIYARQIRSW